MPNPVRSAFIYLMHLAWKSRLHIPFLLTVCFLVFDIRLQLEVNINMTRRRAPRLVAGNNDNNGNYAANNADYNIDDDANEHDDDDDNDDDDEDDDDSRNDHRNRLTIEECKRIRDASEIENFTNIMNILPSLRVPMQKYPNSSKILILRPSLFHQISTALEKHYKTHALQSSKTAPSVIFESHNGPRCVL